MRPATASRGYGYVRGGPKETVLCCLRTREKENEDEDEDEMRGSSLLLQGGG